MPAPRTSQAHPAALRALRDANGQPYRLVALPSPKPIIEHGERLPAGYANFLIINHAVLLPVYGDPIADKQAQMILAELFPQRDIHPLDCRPLIRQGGSLHCVTMQLAHGEHIQSG